MQDEKFKVKFNVAAERPKVLLDMRNDHESYVLFDILISMFTEQVSQGPKAVRGFDLIVCTINDSSAYKVDVESIKNLYSSEVLERLGIQFVTLDCDAFVSENTLENIRLDLENFQAFVSHDMEKNQIKTYSDLLSQIVDISTKEDIAEIVHENMVLSAAQQHMCSVVVKSHSMTKMAVDILSDTIRGRGSEIPLKFQDKYSSGDFEVIFPLRDVLNSEIRLYSKIKSLDDLSPILKVKFSVSDRSTKNKTVNNMVTEYFQTLELEYPEVVSTVVKIGAKLTNIEQHSSAPLKHCEICKVAIYHDPKQWLEQITVPGHVGPQSEEEEANLKRYVDSLVTNVDSKPETKQINETETNLCYGCMVTLGVSEIKDFQWPEKPTREEILAEYIIDDSE